MGNLRFSVPLPHVSSRDPERELGRRSSLLKYSWGSGRKRSRANPDKWQKKGSFMVALRSTARIGCKNDARVVKCSSF